MSHYRESRFNSQVNIQAFLREIGSNMTFQEPYPTLLQEYRQSRLGADAAIAFEAAMIAHAEISPRHPGVELNELGVYLPRQTEDVYNGDYSNKITPEERQFQEQMIEANKDFLDAWKRARDRKTEEYGQLVENVADFRDRVEQTLNHGRGHLVFADTIDSTLKGLGYGNFSMDVASTSAAELLFRGIEFTAQNQFGTLDVTFGGGRLYVHFEDNDPRMGARCQNQLRLVIEALERAFGGIDGPGGGGISIIKKTEGAGRGNTAPAEEPEEEEHIDFSAETGTGQQSHT